MDTRGTTGSRRSPPTRRRLRLRARRPATAPRSRAPATARRRGSRSRSAPTAARRGRRASRSAPARAPASSTRSSRSCRATATSTRVYMNGFNIMFTKSTNHGQTWSAPVQTYGNVSWNDKPVIAMSDNGQDVYISFNGPTGGDPWVGPVARRGRDLEPGRSSSTATATSSRSTPTSPRTGRSTSRSRASCTAAAATRARRRPADRPPRLHLARTTARRGRTDLVASVQPGVACDAAGCTPDFYLGHTASCRSTASSNVVFLYDGATTAGGLQTISARRSTDGGVDVERGGRAVGGRRERDGAGGRVARQRRRPGVLLPDLGRRQRRRLEHLVSHARPTAARRGPRR